MRWLDRHFASLVAAYVIANLGLYATLLIMR